jgi:hypothetical protein
LPVVSPEPVTAQVMKNLAIHRQWHDFFLLPASKLSPGVSRDHPAWRSHFRKMRGFATSLL